MKRSLVASVLAGSLIASACASTVGSDDVAQPTTPPTTISATASTATTSTTTPAELPTRAAIAVAVEVPDRISSEVSATIAGRAISELADDLFAALRAESPGKNVSLSPTSIAIALAMLEPGTVSEGQTQIHELLRIDDPAQFHASMNQLEQSLEARGPREGPLDEDPGELEVRIANAAYLQKGYPFEADYLNVIGTNYGSTLNEVDFVPDPDAVAVLINDFIAEATNDHITDLLAPGDIDPATVLALVNALYLNASWLEPFAVDDTADRTFTTADGSTVEMPLMFAASDSSSRGDGWVGATKQLTGGLGVEFVLPDEGRFDEIADKLDSVWDDWSKLSSTGSRLGVPRFETRTSVRLDDALIALGLTAVYEPGNLLGVAPDDRLVVYSVLHEAYVAMDEEGIEAAAATVILAYPVSGPENPPVPVILDRSFLYRIVDYETGATLFIGQVINPTE